MSKNILIMVPSLGMGGMERMLVNVANVLVERKHKVTVINLTSHNETIISELDSRVNYKSCVNPKKFFFKATFKDILKGNVRLLPFKYWTKVHSSRYLHNCYIREKYDTEIAFYTGYCVKIINGCSRDTKKIFWLHGEAWQMDGIIQGYFSRRTAKKVYSGYDQIICVSKRIENDFIKRFGPECNITTINNLNDINMIQSLAKESLDIKKEKFTIVSVGRLDNNHKGFDRLLEVANKLNKDGFEYELWIIGNGDGYEYLSDYIKENNLSNVKLFGEQSNPYKYIKNSDLYVCASRFEGYGLAVAEALILGIPVLSTNTSGPAEILDNGKYGRVVENKTDSIYCGIKNMFENKEQIVHYRNQAIARQDFFNREKIIDSIERAL